MIVQTKFQSTPSARRATCILGEDGGRRKISIHALREEGDPKLAPTIRSETISIHALREEGDPSPRPQPGISGISIHALREEGDRLES